MIKNLIKSISKKEWKFFFFIVFFIVLITTLPYLYGWYQTPDNQTYLGLNYFSSADTHVYFSYIEQVKHSQFVFEDLYTAEPQDPTLISIFWFVLGLLAKLFNLSSILIFHLIRILLIPIFLFLLYLLSVYFWLDLKWRKICFIFLTFASGLGFTVSGFIKQLSQKPLDLWVPESNNLLIMLQSPHFIAFSILMIVVFFLMFLALETNRARYSIIAGLLALILFQFHPYHIPTIFGVLFLYLLIQFIKHQQILIPELRNLIIFSLLSLPAIIYWLVLVKTNFIIQIKTYQNFCLTPAFWIILFSYGFLFINPS